ncbi:MAG: DUF1343 domain-containing protein [Pseudobacteriovorax sp.]|nr:DUF1343 domain-containing protein [Pseudobacteriovorax sp.]
MKIGLEVVRDNPQLCGKWGNIGLLCNQASVTRDFVPAWDIFRSIAKDQLVCFFGPQHGFHATVQDNMIETGHSKGPFGLPLFSLYSETREPTSEMLSEIDTIVIDLQIVGCRVYTYKYTMAGCLRAASKFGKKVVVLDRVNPLGGVFVEGRRLDLRAKSFVGEFEIPLRHGLTPGELAHYFNRGIGAELEVVEMESWNPDSFWTELPYRWVLTSPNLPTTSATYVFPATVMFEGTNVSEGRGTGLPFQFIGAPFLDAHAFCKRVEELYSDRRGVYFRPVEFQPTSQKWAGKTCQGLQIHILDHKRIETFRLGLALIKAAIEIGGQSFEWKPAGYEYDFSNLPIDLILGDISAGRRLIEQADFHEQSEYWNHGINEFLEIAQKYLIYPRHQQAVMI